MFKSMSGLIIMILNYKTTANTISQDGLLLITKDYDT